MSAKYYSNTHEWIKLNGNLAIIGISNYAKNELGDVAFLEIKKSVGEKIIKKESFALIESVKAVSEIYCPLTGNILEINKNIIDKPTILNSKNPADDNWLIKIIITEQSELKELMNEETYKKYITFK